MDFFRNKHSCVEDCFANVLARTEGKWVDEGISLSEINRRILIINKLPKETICPYDGMELVSYDPEVIQWFSKAAQRKKFQLQETKDYFGNLIRLTGKFKNLKISVSFLKRQIVIHGSLHVFYNVAVNNAKQNYNTFYWKHLMVVYRLLLKNFSDRILLFHLINLEIGFNHEFLFGHLFTIKEIQDNIFYFNNRCESKNHIKRKNRGSYSDEKDASYQKLYDKGLHYKIKTGSILRPEIGFKRRREIEKKLGINHFFELFDPDTLSKAKALFKLEFSSFLVLQPGFIKYIPQEEIVKNKTIAEFTSSCYWCTLRKKNKGLFRKNMELYKKLVIKYCPFDIQPMVYNLIHSV